eukprot:CAMPEP_0113634202 /NCGR_PEP_ID=MMETSP0017_2-20120614/17807_1 /TAXON_ID=2856 /ORGANISM="Cylindrotheca closterium" /LENGTH=134 /DNA_ID=CAMNT_0000544887 /DNA_START=41 /DNA_END=445 /DNA_ORIENTATION=+ /assembly_acc=CAM_ASM_000147
MAPNLKHRPSPLQTVDVDLVQPVKAAFPPLTSTRPANAAVVASQQQQQQDSSNYWAWSAENDAEISEIVDEERVSADHIVANILRQPAFPTSSTLAVNDQCWDWSHAKTESTDYWNWQATNDDEQQDSDSYWAW